MATIQVSDIKIYKNGIWRSLKENKIFKNGKWNIFNTGSGIYKNGNWYLLKKKEEPKPPDPELQTTPLEVDIYGVSDSNAKLLIRVKSDKNVASDLELSLKLVIYPSGSGRTYEKQLKITIPKNSNFVEKTTDMDFFSISCLLEQCTFTPDKDSTYEYITKYILPFWL